MKRKLSAAELDRVAAAGSKPGGTGDGVTGAAHAVGVAAKPHA